MIQFPPYLKPGDQIGMVCPAGYMAEEKYKECIQTLAEWGFRIKLGQTLGKQFHYFSGTDEERLKDLQSMMDDDSIQAIICARGGYGTGRIIDALDFSRFIKYPKWIVGFSDITVIHSHLLSRYKIASIHGPMAAAFQDKEKPNPYLESLRQTLYGEHFQISTPPHALNQIGEGSGILVGGNLTLVAHLIGSPSDVDMNGKILFLEDIGEYIYNVDRMMYQLKRSGKLEGLKGLIIGHFTDMKDTSIPFGESVENAIKAIVKDASFPVCFHFPVSHDRENYALKVGANYQLKVESNEVILKEIDHKITQ